MNKSEEQTRREIIDKRLFQSGWDVKDPSKVTEELDIWIGLPEGVKEPKDKYQGHLFADYALLGKDGYPLAIVEAKKTSIDPITGKEQARVYAEQIKKKMNREMPFVFYTNGYDIYFWDTDRYPPRKVYGFPTRDDLERIRFLRDNNSVLSETMIDKNIAGRPYQIHGIRAVLDELQNKKRKFLMVMATGTGKTRTCMALLDVLVRSNWIQRVLFLVDRIALQIQALDNFKEHLPNAPLWPQKEEANFSADRRVYVTTYPTMLNIIESKEMKISPFFFDFIVADESHRSIYNIYKNIFDYFDSVQLGLTATPKDHVEHNTFKLFECENELPTFAYSYEEAVNNIPPYLSEFEVLKLRTKFQDDGINAKTISDAEKKRLMAEGKDIDDIDFEGTELEKRVTNKGTNALIIREFMEECNKDQDGVLPGKTIFFAMTQKHARRLYDIFNLLYPEYKGQLAEVITSNMKGVHGKGGLIDRFKNQNMPRIAISVDMLDTGIDIREIVNLVFVKPVFSYTKFWQMIGRGTRVLDEKEIKSWCLKKDKFLIIDCWENFEYFGMKPKGKEPGTKKALPVRIFEARINKLIASINNITGTGIYDKIKSEIIADIENLPDNSVVVLENKADLELVKDQKFWNKVTNDNIEYLRLTIAPVMRARSGSDFKAMRFELTIIELSTALIEKNIELFDTLKEEVIEIVSRLPMTVNIVAKEKELIQKVKEPYFWNTVTEDDFDIVIQHLAPLMKFIDDTVPATAEIKLDIDDILSVKEYIEFGPENERMTVSRYREKVESKINELLDTNPVLQKLKNGESLSAHEIRELANILEKEEPYVTENILQKIYDNKKAKFIQFIKHMLGMEEISTFTETVSAAFEAFISEHNNYSQQQIQFLLILKTFILERGVIEKRNLIEAPFTQLHPMGIRGIFTTNDINEILAFTNSLTA